MMTKVSCLNPPIKKKRKSYKRPSNNPTYMPALRIFRNDIRRRYIDMLTNVINSYDMNLHLKFFQEYALPTTSYTYHRFPPERLELLPHPPHLVGFEQILYTNEIHYLMIPDFVHRFDNIKVCKTLGSPGSRIIATARASGTMQFVVSMNKSIKSNPDDSSSLTRSESELTSSSIVSSSCYNLKPILLERLPEPIDFDSSAMVTITLDDEHRIISIELFAM